MCTYLNYGETQYRGKIVWVKVSLNAQGKPVLDDKNPDLNKRNQPVKGLEFMYGFTFQKPDKWVNGDIYDAESGKTYTAQMTLIDANTLDLRGYIGIPLLGRSERWKRLK